MPLVMVQMERLEFNVLILMSAHRQLHRALVINGIAPIRKEVTSVLVIWDTLNEEKTVKISMSVVMVKDFFIEKYLNLN